MATVSRGYPYKKNECWLKPVLQDLIQPYPILFIVNRGGCLLPIWQIKWFSIKLAMSDKQLRLRGSLINLFAFSLPLLVGYCSLFRHVTPHTTIDFLGLNLAYLKGYFIGKWEMYQMRGVTPYWLAVSYHEGILRLSLRRGEVWRRKSLSGGFIDESFLRKRSNHLARTHIGWCLGNVYDGLPLGISSSQANWIVLNK